MLSTDKNTVSVQKLENKEKMYVYYHCNQIKALAHIIATVLDLNITTE